MRVDAIAQVKRCMGGQMSQVNVTVKHLMRATCGLVYFLDPWHEYAAVIEKWGNGSLAVSADEDGDDGY
jgi:hypothetical protein